MEGSPPQILTAASHPELVGIAAVAGTWGWQQLAGNQNRKAAGELFWPAIVDGKGGCFAG